MMHMCPENPSLEVAPTSSTFSSYDLEL